MRYGNIILRRFGKLSAARRVIFQLTDLMRDSCRISHLKHCPCRGKPVELGFIFKDMRSGQNRQAKLGRLQRIMPAGRYQRPTQKDIIGKAE